MEKRLIDANKLMQDVEKLLYKGNPIVAFMQKQVDKQPTIYDVSWIPVEERLPEIKEGFCSKDVIVALDNGSLAFTCLESNTFGQVCWQVELVCELQFEKDVNVIAWMPLPEPYREREGEQPERSSE